MLISFCSWCIQVIFTLSQASKSALIKDSRFPYPITTTFIELLFTQFFLVITASITRSFSRSLHSLGLGGIVAPHPRPGKGKRRAGSGGLREFSQRLLPLRTSGGIFEVRWSELKPLIPLAIIYSGKIVLSSLAFGFTQLQIYQLSRTPSLLLCIGFTYFFNSTYQSLSVTTLSSCITMVCSLAVLSVGSQGVRFAKEGFIAGIASTVFVAAYPVILTRTWRSWSQARTEDNRPTSGPELEREEARSAWKLLHYVNFCAMVGVGLLALLSGEIRDIGRNCYILDVAWFWIMAALAGLAAWATFVCGFLLVRVSMIFYFYFFIQSGQDLAWVGRRSRC